jgi:hypothetical protein
MIALGNLLLGRVPALGASADGAQLEPKFDLAKELEQTLDLEAPAADLAPVIELPAPEVELSDLAAELVTKDDDEDSDEPPPTPLEQAVLDMLERREPPAEIAPPKPEVQNHAPRIVTAAPVTEPRALPEQASPTSHVNLVLDDGDRRLVVTVAVRGDNVNVALRGNDDATAAALARNAATLDHALHTRGLSLAEFSTGRDPERHHERPRQERTETHDKTARERFVLEETK